MNFTTTNDNKKTESNNDAVVTQLAGKYLTFVLGGEEYGLDIVKIREIIKIMEITTVPKTPDYVKGVINLRGRVIPVVDLRLQFGMESAKFTKETCVIVVDVKGMMGVIVDTVSEVVDITEGQIEPPPFFGSTVNTLFILGIGKVKKKVKILLDIDKILSGVDLEMVTAGHNGDGGYDER